MTGCPEMTKVGAASQYLLFFKTPPIRLTNHTVSALSLLLDHDRAGHHLISGLRQLWALRRRASGQRPTYSHRLYACGCEGRLLGRRRVTGIAEYGLRIKA